MLLNDRNRFKNSIKFKGDSLGRVFLCMEDANIYIDMWDHSCGMMKTHITRKLYQLILEKMFWRRKLTHILVCY